MDEGREFELQGERVLGLELVPSAVAAASADATDKGPDDVEDEAALAVLAVLLLLARAESWIVSVPSREEELAGLCCCCWKEDETRPKSWRAERWTFRMSIGLPLLFPLELDCLLFLSSCC